MNYIYQLFQGDKIKENKKISVILPSYNQSKYLRRAIESVLYQTYANLELIIIEDASTDLSLSIAREYEKSDTRIHLVTHNKNKGFTRSLNDGLGLTNGNFIAIHNSDDIWHHNKLQEQVKIFEKFSRIDIVVSDALIIDSQGRRSNIIFSKKNKWKEFGIITNVFHKLCDFDFCCHPSLIFRKKCLLSVPKYDESLYSACDWWFLINLSKKHKFFYIKEPLLDYRVHPQNLSGNNKIVYQDAMLIRKRIADMQINRGNNLSKAAIYAAMIGNHNTAIKLARSALEEKSLNTFEVAVMNSIMHFKSSGSVFSKLNKLRHFSNNLSRHFYIFVLIMLCSVLL